MSHPFKLTQEIIDFLCPEHGRTSCNDKNPCNGMGSNGDFSVPRCTRCGLLELMNEGLDLLGIYHQRLDVQFVKTPWKKDEKCPTCRNIIGIEGPRFCPHCGHQFL